MTRITYQIRGSVRNDAPRSWPLAQIGKNRPAVKIERMRQACAELTAYPEGARHG